MFPSIFLWNIQIDTIGVPIYSMGCAEIRYIMNPVLKLYVVQKISGIISNWVQRGILHNVVNTLIHLSNDYWLRSKGAAAVELTLGPVRDTRIQL